MTSQLLVCLVILCGLTSLVVSAALLLFHAMSSSLIVTLIKQVDKTQPDIACKRHKKTDKCHWIEHCPNGYYCSVTIRWKVPTNKCLWTTTIHQSRSNTINYKWSLSIHPQIHFHQAWIKFGVYEGGRIAGAENDGPTVKKTVMHKICYSMIYLAELQVCTTTHFSIFIRISA